MGLKIKTFKYILNDMANWISSRNSKLNNFYVGSVTRTLLEAVSMEIESMYFQMYKGFKYAIENAIFHSFGFYKFPSTPSSGQLLLTFKFPLSDEVILPKGYRFSTVPSSGQPVYFEVTQDTLFLRNSTTGTVSVTCTEPDVIGNVPAYSIRICVIPLPYILDVYNPEPFANGRPEEGKEERKQRFTRYVETLARGTINAITYGCSLVPGVSGVYVSEQIGLITVYAHDSEGNLTPELKSSIVEILKSYKPAGVPVDIVSVTKKLVDLYITITLENGYDTSVYSTKVRDSVILYLSEYTVSKSLTRSELVRFVMSIDSDAIVDVNTNMDSSIVVDKSELIRPGIITVTAQ